MLSIIIGAITIASVLFGLHVIGKLLYWAIGIPSNEEPPPTIFVGIIFILSVGMLLVFCYAIGEEIRF